MRPAGPQVSVGVPVYNGERYLAATLDSLLAQTFTDFELIVCDNASTDGTQDIGRAYAAADSRVRYVRNPRNVGLAGNYRRAFELASGEYFRWSAADDVSAPEFLACCVDVLDARLDVVLAYPKTKFIDENGTVLSDYDDGLHLQSRRPSERFRRLLERVGYVNAMYGLVRSTALRQTRLLGTYPASDIVLLAELSLLGTFWEVPKFLFCRRFHAEASSSMGRGRIWAFYDPDGDHRLLLLESRHVVEFFRVVARAPLAMSEKLRAAGSLVRRAISNRDKLASELSAAMRELAAKRSRR